MTRTSAVLALACAVSLCAALPARAQSNPKPWGRVSFFSSASHIGAEGGGTATTFNELTTAIAYQLPDVDADGTDYGVDFRYSTYAGLSRPQRVSLYEGFVGLRFAGGTMRARVGHIWLNELGALGSVAGGAFEYRQARQTPTGGRFRIGAFGGLEPNVIDTGYASNVKKAGVYAAYDGEGARRHVLGFVTVKDGSVTERSVLTTTNFVPLRQNFFLYQAAEFDVQAPAGQASSGLAYFFTTARFLPEERVEVQMSYNRGHSIDTRSLSDDVLNGRALTQAAINGLRYESLGGRVTVEVVPRVRVYAGYARDKNDRDSASTGRLLVGGYAPNAAGFGFDLAASDSYIGRPTGSYHSQYVSIGRQIGRTAYVSGDYSTSLSVVQFSRSDGILVELRPHTSRFSGTATINLPRQMSLMLMAERTLDDRSNEFRLMTGITYRFR